MSSQFASASGVLPAAQFYLLQAGLMVDGSNSSKGSTMGAEEASPFPSPSTKSDPIGPYYGDKE